MHRLKFNIEGVKKIYQHSLDHPVFTPSLSQMYEARYRKDGKPFDEAGGRWPELDQVDCSKLPGQFTIVKDRGIYLMAATEKTLKGENSPNFVVYAEGFDPNKEDVWDAAMEIMGGDDGGDMLPLEWLEKAIENAEETGNKYMVIGVRTDSLELILRRRASNKNLSDRESG